MYEQWECLISCLGEKSNDNEVLIDIVKEGDTETAEMLLAKGADVNAKQKGGITALMHVTVKGHTGIICLLK